MLVCDRDSEKLKKITDAHINIKATIDPSLCASSDVIFLAVKPQDFASIMVNFKKDALLCSIMAGISIASLRRFGVEKIVRMMPNTPAQVVAGFTVWTATDAVASSDKILLEKILSCMGKHLYVEREDDINKATAISGSGPAYFFLMVLELARVAEELGFEHGVAVSMAVQTIKGASALIDEKSDLDELINKVASKGGTTEAALAVFEQSKIDKIWEAAVHAAYKRARELSR